MPTEGWGLADMRVAIEIGGKLNSGVNGCLLRNCSIASGETASSHSYIQNFRRNKKIAIENDEIKILGAFKSRNAEVFYIIAEADGEAEGDSFEIYRMRSISDFIYNPFPSAKKFKKLKEKMDFSFDFAKLEKFINFDCIVVCAYGVLVAFSEINFKFIEIDTSNVSNGNAINGICAFANRLVATFEDDDNYYWSGIGRADFDFERKNPAFISSDAVPPQPETLPTGAGFAATEYANDMTLAVRRTGSRLAVFTRTTIEIKDVSQDPDLPFQGFLYQNNFDIGIILETIRSISGVLYFVGEESTSLRYIYSLADGVPRKLTSDAQSALLSGAFRGSGVFAENGIFYCVYGSRNFGIDIGNGSLLEIDSEFEFLEYGHRGQKQTRLPAKHPAGWLGYSNTPKRIKRQLQPNRQSLKILT